MIKITHTHGHIYSKNTIVSLMSLCIYFPLYFPPKPNPNRIHSVRWFIHLIQNRIATTGYCVCSLKISVFHSIHTHTHSHTDTLSVFDRDTRFSCTCCVSLTLTVSCTTKRERERWCFLTIAKTVYHERGRRCGKLVLN